MNSWFSKLVSLDEMKTSSLIISFLIFSGIAVYLLITKGEIPQNLTTLLSIEIGVIGGVNCFNYVSTNMAMSRNNQQIPYQTNTYGSNMYGNNTMGMNASYPMQPGTVGMPTAGAVPLTTTTQTTTTQSMPRM